MECKRAKVVEQVGQAKGACALEGCGLPVDPSVDIRTFLRFLEVREGPNGRTILDYLGPPRDRENGWVSLDLVELPEVEAAWLEGEGWQTAWHGD